LQNKKPPSGGFLLSVLVWCIIKLRLINYFLILLKSMKTSKKVLSSLIITIALFAFFSGAKVYASIIPTFTLTIVDTSSSVIRVHGDPHSAVELHYGTSAAAVRTIGTTDLNGDFSLSLSSQTYNLSQCNQTAYVIVDGQQSQIINWSSGNNSCTNSSSGNPSFSQNNVVINVGQNLSVYLVGNGSYSISSNSNSGTISATLIGSTINLYASSFGGANISVCQSDGQCNTIYVVSVNGTAPQASTVSNPPAVLSSFSVSSNDAYGTFANIGDVLTISFNTNQQVGNVSVSVAGKQIGVSGNGTGPYKSTYTVTGNEGLSIPVVMRFVDLDGRTNQGAFSIGSNSSSNTSSAVSSNTTGSVSSSNVSSTASNTSTVPVKVGDGYVFKTFLNLNSTGTEVTELQKRLTAFGIYSGPITGTFGPLTETAVKVYQAAHGITQAGYVGPSTRTALNQ
jgi:hypothetical protein